MPLFITPTLLFLFFLPWMRKLLSFSSSWLCVNSPVPFFFFISLCDLKSPLFPVPFFLPGRSGLLHDVTMILCELELVIKRVKISTTPDGSVMDFFFKTDRRDLLHTKSRQEDAYSHLKAVLGDVMIRCDIELDVKEMETSSQGNTFLPPALAEEMFSLERPKEPTSGCSDKKNISVIMDNYLSVAHALIQIQCEDHKGLLYDIMRTLKDYNIQAKIGRHVIRDREWEVYKICLGEGNGFSLPTKKIEGEVRNMWCSHYL